MFFSVLISKMAAKIFKMTIKISKDDIFYYDYGHCDHKIEFLVIDHSINSLDSLKIAVAIWFVCYLSRYSRWHPRW